MPAFTLAFVIDAPSGAVELWLGDVHFEQLGSFGRGCCIVGAF